MEPANITFRLLETKIAYVQHTLDRGGLTPEETDRQELLMEVIEQYIRDLRRQKIERRAGTLEDLAQMKVGIRLADVLLDLIRDAGAEAMEGWQYGWNANPVQKQYTFVYDLAMRLGWSIAEVERQFPEHQEWFDAERADYRQTREEDIPEHPTVH